MNGHMPFEACVSRSAQMRMARLTISQPGHLALQRVDAFADVAVPRDTHAGDFFSFFLPGRSAVVRHYSTGPLGLTRVAIGRRSRDFLDPVYGFIAQTRRLTCDACLAQPFDVGHSSIERINKLA
jgi:hypothetical protein